MAVIRGECSMSQAAALLERNGNLTHLQFSQCAAVPVVESIGLPDDALGIFVDGVPAIRGVHPAVARIESLIDEKLAPGHRAIHVQSLLTDHLQFRAEVIRGVRVYPEQGVPRRAAPGRDGETVGAAGNRLCRLNRRRGGERLRPRLPGVEFPKLKCVDAFNIAANAAFSKRQRHPRLEATDDLRRNGGMFRQKVIQSVRPSHHQRLEPRRALAKSLPQAARIDEQTLSKIAEYGCLAFGLRQHPQADEVVPLDAGEVVLGLRIDGTEHRVRVGFAIDMRDAPVVADDADVLGMLPLASRAADGRGVRRRTAQGA